MPFAIVHTAVNVHVPVAEVCGLDQTKLTSALPVNVGGSKNDICADEPLVKFRTPF
ncbi:MAG TPA: hypothetical protein VMQ50_18440 [Casimicrobiaceae bacterium]|nr:hypothetical protein [Casimicrobiaceae bacterium]